MKKCVVYIFIILSFITVSTNASEAYKILFIANQNLELDSINIKEIQHLFLGKNVYDNNGVHIKPYLLKDKLTTEAFCRYYLKINRFQYRVFWKKAIFTGKGVPPKSFKTHKDLFEAMKKKRNSISFILDKNSIEIPDFIKIIDIIK